MFITYFFCFSCHDRDSFWDPNFPFRRSLARNQRGPLCCMTTRFSFLQQDSYAEAGPTNSGQTHSLWVPGNRQGIMYPILGVADIDDSWAWHQTPAHPPKPIESKKYGRPQPKTPNSHRWLESQLLSSPRCEETNLFIWP